MDIFMIGVLAVAFLPADSPSFNCAYANTAVEQLICRTPQLSALDRELADVFNNTVHQAGIDGKVLRREEDQWLKETRDACQDVDCVKSAYQTRLSSLREASLRAASPAAYDETHPFLAAAPSVARARALVGQKCSNSAAFEGFEPIRGFLPIILNGFAVYPKEANGDRFAFLVQVGGDEPCTIVDVAALPSSGIADAFMSCSGPDVPSPGVGLRKTGERRLAAYWYVDPGTRHLERQPLDVLAARESTRCREPESGE